MRLALALLVLGVPGDRAGHAADSSTGAAHAPRAHAHHLPALIISGSDRRFERARSAAWQLGFTATLSPAVFLPKGHECRRVQGGEITSVVLRNGLRLALRDAWLKIVRADRPMAVFEDDITPAMHDGMQQYNVSAVRSFIDKCSRTRCDVAYLGEVPQFWSTYAQWVTPSGAKKLLNITDECLSIDRGTDSRIGPMCRQREYIHCMHAPGVGLGQQTGGKEHAYAARHADLNERTWGVGFFIQDRRNIPSLIHDNQDRTCARIETQSSGERVCVKWERPGWFLNLTR